MRDLLSILGHLPFLIPLGGALLILALPQDTGVNLDGPRAWARRWLYLLTLVLTLGVLLFGRARPDLIYQLPYMRGLLPYGESLAWSSDSLAKAYGLLICGVLMLTAVGNIAGRQSRAQAVLILVMLAAVLGMVAAWNMVTLVLFAMLLDVAVMTRSVIRVPEENLPHATRQTLVNLASVVLLVLALVSAMAEQYANQPAWYSADGLPRNLLMLAVLVRLGMYPLPGSTKRRWEVYLLSAGAGAYLWLRLVLANPTGLPYAGWLVPLSWAAVGVSALLAALAPQYSLAVPWLILNQVALLVLAPYMAPVAGARVVLLGIVQLVLMLALLRMDADLLVAGARADHRLQRWVPWPFVVAMASLGGVPLTLGGGLRWSLLQLCWLRGWNNLVPLLAVFFALLSMPALLRLRQVWTPMRRQPVASRWRLWAAVGAALAAALALLVLGLLGPWLAGRITAPYQVLPQTESAGATPALVRSLVLALTAYVVPVLGGLALYRFRRPLSDRMATLYEWLNAPLEIDWLYGVLERVLQRLQSWVGAALAGVEGSFYVLWTVLCSLALAFLLIGR